jgi:hypothetical protein
MNSERWHELVQDGSVVAKVDIICVCEEVGEVTGA